MNASPKSKGTAARRVAIKAMVRIEKDAAYANLVLGPILERSALEDRDRAFVTELVYGTTRMKRACDFLVDRFVLGDTDDQVRAALRLGAYQLHFLGLPHHAAVGATAGAVRGPGRGMVNAILRKVATADVQWPSDAVRLSYPDWLLKLLASEFGQDQAIRWLEEMNERPKTHSRADGYVQDLASQEVVRLAGSIEGEKVLDLCAAPGGKATGMAASGAFVVAADSRPSRVSLMASNIVRLDSEAAPIIADGLHPPFAAASFDRVLVDAPCTGIGSLRRRADGRWRIDPQAPERLAHLQLELLRSASVLIRDGGQLVYSVCTMTGAETAGVVSRFLAAEPRAELMEGPEGDWFAHGPVHILPPSESDGMAIARFKITQRDD